MKLPSLRVRQWRANPVARLDCIATLPGPMKLSAILTCLLLTTACAGPRLTASSELNSSWRAIATSDDRERLREWRAAFAEALATARRSYYGPDLVREGILLAPDAALPGPALPDGEYRCRVVKVGARSEGLLDYIAYPSFRCRVRQSGPLQSLAKLGGSQRYIGTVFPGDSLRQVFLGTLALGDETRALDYGVDRERNVAGHIERIGQARWRLVMPRPHFESKLDVLELIPAT